MSTILAVDIGNSSVQLGLWEGNAFTEVISIPGSQLSSTLQKRGLRPNLVAVSCVAEKHFDGFRQLAAAWLESTPLFLGRELNVPLQVSVDNPEAVGSDRLAAALAAHRQCGAAVVVDAGTAITVDAVTAGGEFLGGSIMPGPELCLRALGQGTSKVSVSGPVKAVRPPGKNTTDAVHCALSFGLAGAIDRLVAELETQLGGNAALVAAGGALELFLPLCRSQFAVRQNLVLEGLVIAAVEAGINP